MEIIYDVLNERYEKLLKDKVSYYWEGTDTSPVIEVFVHGSSGKIKILEKLLEKEIEDYGLVAQSEIWHQGKDYYSVALYVSNNILEKDLLDLANILKKYGNCQWEDVK